jgi:hypothetical protein
MFIKKSGPAGDFVVGDLSQIADTSFVAMYPALAEYVFFTSYPDGSKRVPSTLSLLPSFALWSVCLNDRDQSRVLWSSGETLSDCFGLLDEMLRGEFVPWKVDRRLPKK